MEVDEVATAVTPVGVDTVTGCVPLSSLLQAASATANSAAQA
jgi:hypothetical protein